MSQETELESVLHEEIPLTRAMGVAVLEWSGSALRIGAPLTNNVNHKCTAFGGSLYVMAVLSGWGLLYVLLKQAGLSAHIVIQESHIEYTAPVTNDIVAECRLPADAALARLIKTFERKGRARIELNAVVMQAGEPAVTFKGRYVIHR